MKSISADQIVQLIHDAPRRIVLAVSGGGGRAIADLLQVPGASKTVLEAVVPYSPKAMIDWLGAAPDEFCSSATGRGMALTAFHRARRLYEPAENTAGVACTASLASDRPKRGPHRIHVALQTADETAVWSLHLLKERRSREEEERLAGRMVLNAVAAACELNDRLELELLEGERVEESRVRAPREWRELLLGAAESVRIGPNIGAPRLVFPGAFNPLHSGHRRMFEIARQIARLPAALELSIVNVDKPPLDYMEIVGRVAQFPPDWTVYFTRAPRFEEKSRLFAGTTFIVGADTLRRIGSPRYHGGDAAACRESLERIAANGCRFMVFCRRLEDGAFARLADLDIPDALRALCREVPPEIFRDEVSSTALRKPEAG